MKDEGVDGLKMFSNIIDIMFLIDIFIIFFSAIQTEELEIIHDRKEIAVSYLTGWFTIDLIAILPFEWFVGDQ